MFGLAMNIGDNRYSSTEPQCNPSHLEDGCMMCRQNDKHMVCVGAGLTVACSSIYSRMKCACSAWQCTKPLGGELSFMPQDCKHACSAAPACLGLSSCTIAMRA